MNHAKAIEIALATVIREFADIEDGAVTIRAFQTLDLDKTWNAARDRTFPVIDVRAAPPRTDDNQATLRIDCAVLVGTNAEDDKNHAELSALYGAVQDVLDALFSQFRIGSDSDDELEDELAMFLRLMAENTDTNTFSFGGFTFGESLAPYEEAGANMIGQTLVTHYGRPGF